MHQLSFSVLDLCYSHLNTLQGNYTDITLDVAIRLVDHVAPDIRLAAVQLLSASAKQLSCQAAQQMTHKDQSRLDLVFQKLCSVVTMDIVPAVRLEALAGLSDMHHASLAVRRQALSKRATYTVATAHMAASDAGLLDSATGAFVHGSEDDVEKVRLATIHTMKSLGDRDKQFADEAAIILTSLVSDELLNVRKAALRVLLHWATAFHQQYLLLQQQKALQPHEQQANPQLDGREQCQQWQQGGHVLPAEAAAASGSVGMEAEDDYSEEEEGQCQHQHQGNAAAAATPVAPGATAHPASGTAAPKPRRGGRKISKKRRGDTPPWGPDALSAAVTALHDSDVEARQLALQLAQLLPPNGVQAVMGLVQGLIDCCERFHCQHLDTALQIAAQLGQNRAIYVGMIANKLVKILCNYTSAAEDTSADASVMFCDSRHVWGSKSSNSMRKSSRATHLGPGSQILQIVLLTAADVRPQIAQPVLQQLVSQGLHQQQQLTTFVQRLSALQQQH